VTKALSGLLALATALLCALAFIGGSGATPGASSSESMSMPHTATRLTHPETAVPPLAAPVLDVGTPDLLGGMCRGVCASHSAAACALVVLALASLLGLLMSQRRDTYLGIAARLVTRPTPRQHGRERPPRWTVLTLTDLCVLRV
jgi:hypothetical protein